MRDSADFHKIIGEICMHFAALDFFVTCLISRIIDKKNRHRFDEKQTLNQKLSILGELHQSCYPSLEIHQSIQNLLPEAKEVSKIRNRYIHDQWVIEPNALKDGVIHRFRLDGEYNIVRDEEHIQNLHKLMDRICTLQNQVGSIFTQLRK